MLGGVGEAVKAYYLPKTCAQFVGSCDAVSTTQMVRIFIVVAVAGLILSLWLFVDLFRIAQKQ